VFGKFLMGVFIFDGCLYIRFVIFVYIRYSVVFCGPGGCGDPSKARLTYITGDKHWEVISEDELLKVQRPGEKDTYYRCTKDTHPVLRYK
jgi:hypothetical protein